MFLVQSDWHAHAQRPCSHVYVCAFFHSSHVLFQIYEYEGTPRNQTFPSQPANFGAPILSFRIYPRHVMTAPNNLNLCHPPPPDYIITPSPVSPGDAGKIALLGKRGDCTFETKVRVALQYSVLCDDCIDTAILFDNYVEDVLPSWNVENATGLGGIKVLGLQNAAGNGLVSTIAAAQESGAYDLDNGVPIRFDGGYYLPYETYQEWLMTMIGSVVLVVGSLVSVCFCLKAGYIRRENGSLVIGRGGRREEVEPLMTKAEVRALPDITYKAPAGGDDLGDECANDEGDNGEGDNGEGDNGEGDADSRTSYFENNCCSVCLEDYSPGETLTLLPCKHAFHGDCVLPWLTTQHASCPLCKADVLSEAAKEGKREAASRRILSDITGVPEGNGGGGGEEQEGITTPLLPETAV